MKGKLVIISHTEHYLNKQGSVVGWGPTIREINYLSQHFETISHIGVLYPNEPPKSSEGYGSDNIRFVPLKPTGGNGFWKKTTILLSILNLLNTVRTEISDADFVQLRVPTGIGVILLPYFAITKSKRQFLLWVKYAGNWNEFSPPYGYAFQRWFLKKNFANCKVTINGFWKNQPKHCISFENPCITEDQLQIGRQILNSRKFEPPFSFTFIGRLEDAKGVQRILNVFQTLKHNNVKTLVFIGDGLKREWYEQFSREIIFVEFTGGLTNEEVHSYLDKSDFLLLPSLASEGFPKVIAEAACYGVVPIVSDVGSIAHYINGDNGFVCKIEHLKESFESQLKNALKSEANSLKYKSKQVSEVARLFTFEAYLEKLEKFIFNR
jgi:glycosyltransferase involved in cell wall biosynthesis